ncbi:MAG: SurA N-terminal domain-containing protein [Planctomycetota bacterium]|nr:SurA N-terminal domain-containing protein [Planctomycetota bacterium]
MVFIGGSLALALVPQSRMCAKASEPRNDGAPNGVVIKVNGETITVRDVEDRMGSALLELRKWREGAEKAGKWNAEMLHKFEEQYIPSFRQQLRNIAFERLILQSARNEGIAVDETAVKRKLDAARKTPDEQKEGKELVELKVKLRDENLLNTFRWRFWGSPDNPLPTETARRNEREWYHKTLTETVVTDEHGKAIDKTMLRFRDDE